MKFSIGTPVVLIHTGAEGTVVEWLTAEMVKVRLRADGDEIPVFVDDLRHANDPGPVVPPRKAPPAAKKNLPPPPPIPPSSMQYTILKSVGIQLGFDPILRNDGSIEAFVLYLINDTRGDVVYEFHLSAGGRRWIESSSLLKGLSVENLGKMPFDTLNEHPEVHMTCWRLTTAGEGPRQSKELKIKPKTFFTKVLTAPLLDRPVHLFRLFEPLEAEEETPTSPATEEDLRSYTQRKAKPLPHPKAIPGTTGATHEVKALAEFQPELDLHIEKLVADPSKMNKAEILQLQLRYFEEYLDRAVRLGVERVFVIHGLGTGRLRNAITTILVKHPYVKTFHNDYHPRYGHGATEIELL